MERTGEQRLRAVHCLTALSLTANPVRRNQFDETAMQSMVSEGGAQLSDALNEETPETAIEFGDAVLCSGAENTLFTPRSGNECPDTIVDH